MTTKIQALKQALSAGSGRHAFDGGHWQVMPLFAAGRWITDLGSRCWVDGPRTGITSVQELSSGFPAQESPLQVNRYSDGRRDCAIYRDRAVEVDDLAEIAGL